MRTMVFLLVFGLIALAPAQPADEDTVLLYDSGNTTTWWTSNQDSFGAGVKFTPGEYPCEVLGARAEVNHDANGQEIYLRVWDDDGPDGKPGTILYNEYRSDIPPNRTPGWQDYLLTEPVRVDSGDFYVVFWQKNIWDMIFSSDEAMNYPARQWWWFPDQGWVTPYGMHASDHMMRALVRYGSGVEEELGGPPMQAPAVTSNPVTSGWAELAWEVVRDGRVTATVSDAAGRTVRRAELAPGERRLDLRGLAPGAYFVRFEGPATAFSTRLLIAE